MFPQVPDKRYFTIGETSELCLVKPHVLRYWEQEFSQLRPAKRRGNRRYYQHKDIEVVRHIRSLLYEDGFTISGAKRELTRSREALNPATETAKPVTNRRNRHSNYVDIIAELNQLLSDLGESR